MARTAKSNKTFEDAPNLEPGAYAARLVQIIFLGTQKQRPYKGQAKPPHEMVRFVYELSDVFMEDEEGNPIEDRPRWLDEEMRVFSLDAERSGFAQRLKALDPKITENTPLDTLLGKPCQVVVVNNPGKGKNEGRVFDNISDVNAALKVKGYNQPELVNPTTYFDPFDEEECEVDTFRKLPEFIQKKIMGADDYADTVLCAKLSGGSDGGNDTQESSDDKEDGDDSGDDLY